MSFFRLHDGARLTWHESHIAEVLDRNAAWESSLDVFEFSSQRIFLLVVSTATAPSGTISAMGSVKSLEARKISVAA